MVQEQNYAAARAVFQRFKAGLENDGAVLDEICGSLALLHATYNSSLNGNRFPVGEAIEYIIAAAMRCVGLQNVRTIGNRKGYVDIDVDGQPFSLKSSSTGNPDTIGLINTRGPRRTRWNAPTIFILAGRGIGYADPGLLPDAANDDVDQLQLQRAPLESLFQNSPEWLLECDIPVKRPRPIGGERVRTVSEEVARAIINSRAGGQPSFPLLQNNFSPLEYRPE